MLYKIIKWFRVLCGTTCHSQVVDGPLGEDEEMLGAYVEGMLNKKVV